MQVLLGKLQGAGHSIEFAPVVSMRGDIIGLLDYTVADGRIDPLRQEPDLPSAASPPDDEQLEVSDWSFPQSTIFATQFDLISAFPHQ